MLVTGGAGFIGSYIVEQLVAAGHQVTVVDDLSAGPGHSHPGASYRVESVLDTTFPETCRGMDTVIHAAAQTSVSYSVRNPAADAVTNVIGTVKALEAAATGGVRRFVFLSSAAVYGDSAVPPTAEDHPADPVSPYGLSKLVGERYVRLLAEQAGMEWVVLRLANVYGPRQNPAGEAGVVAKWVSALAAGEPITLYGDGGQSRDFVYAGDVAGAVVQAATRTPLACGIYNVGTGSETTLTELLATLSSLTGKAAPVQRAPARSGDLERSALDSSSARCALGWAALTPLADGLAATLAWARRPE